MAERLTPPKYVAKLRAGDVDRLTDLEARLMALEGHTHRCLLGGYTTEPLPNGG